MKKILFVILFGIIFSGCVENFDNGEPPYVIISLDSSFYDEGFYDNALTDSVPYDFTVYLKSVNEAQIGELLILKNFGDTLFYKKYSTIEDVAQKIDYLPELNLSTDTTVYIKCSVKPLNSDIIKEYDIYLDVYPSTK